MALFSYSLTVYKFCPFLLNHYCTFDAPFMLFISYTVFLCHLYTK